jgi:hypothetical protein
MVIVCFYRSSHSIALHHPQGSYVWTGMWPTHLQQDLTDGAFATATWPGPDLSKLRKRLQGVGRILAWGASEIWTARSAAPLCQATLAGLAGQFNAFASYYPAFNRATRSTRPGGHAAPGTGTHQQFSPLPAQANPTTSLQQHRDRIRNSNQRDRRTITHFNGNTQQASRLLTLGTAATLITSSRATSHLETLPFMLPPSISVNANLFRYIAFNCTSRSLVPPISTWHQPSHRPPFYFNALLLTTDSTHDTFCRSHAYSPLSPCHYRFRLQYVIARTILFRTPLIAHRAGVG